MNKKQIAIIVSLLVLIICAGVLATKVNSPLSVSSTDTGSSNSNTSSTSTDKGSASSKAVSKNSSDDYFTEAKLSRDQVTSKTVEALKTIADDKNTAQESRNNAAAKSAQIQAQSVNQNKIETILKGKGYSNVVCTIDDDNKATVIVQYKQKLTDSQSRDIKNVIMSVTKVSDIDIIVKQ